MYFSNFQKVRINPRSINPYSNFSHKTNKKSNTAEKKETSVMKKRKIEDNLQMFCAQNKSCRLEAHFRIFDD